jgi:hypothetical protein
MGGDGLQTQHTLSAAACAASSTAADEPGWIEQAALVLAPLVLVRVLVLVVLVQCKTTVRSSKP